MTRRLMQRVTSHMLMRTLRSALNIRHIVAAILTVAPEIIRSIQFFCCCVSFACAATDHRLIEL